MTFQLFDSGLINIDRYNVLLLLEELLLMLVVMEMIYGL